MLSYARNEEEHIQKEELEKRLFPLWLANYTVAQLNGSEIMDYEAFILQTLAQQNKPMKQKVQKTADDITAEFMPIIEAYRRKEG